MIALKENDNTARKIDVGRAAIKMFAKYYERGAKEDITVIVSRGGVPIQTITTLTPEECLTMLSGAADEAIRECGM